MDSRRKGLLYRSEHRGMREMDILMGGFARTSLPAFDEGELDDFERLLDLPDQDLLNWCLGLEEIPLMHKGNVMRCLIDYAQRTS